jgi:hypothetical protein
LRVDGRPVLDQRGGFFHDASLERNQRGPTDGPRTPRCLYYTVVGRIRNEPKANCPPPWFAVLNQVACIRGSVRPGHGEQPQA